MPDHVLFSYLSVKRFCERGTQYALLHAVGLKKLTYVVSSCPDPVGVTEGRAVAQTAAPWQAGAGHRHHGAG